MIESKSGAARAIVISVGIAVLLGVPAVLLLTSLRAFVNPTGSMEKTLLVGDRLIARTRGIGPLHRGDIVIFHYPIDPRQTFIKRIVGVPMDRIKIAKKQLFINGVPAQEPYVVHESNYMDSYRDNFPSEPNTMVYPPAQEMLAQNVVNGELIVPPHGYFVMGDNRDLSLDSRYWGFVDESQIFGKPLFIYYSSQSDRLFKRVE